MRAPAGIVVLAAVLSLSPSGAQGQSGIRGEIEALNSKLEGWYAAGQIDSVTAVFAEDVWQLPPNAPPVMGRDSAHAFWTGLTRQGRVVFDLVTQDLVAADSIVVERGAYAVRFIPNPQGQVPAFEDRGNYVVLWRREADGQLRIVWDAPVSVMPLPGAPAQ
jgi:ketosteroid isomerase-like protein